MTPRNILVVLGTDHHRFDRAVAWADDWASRHPQDHVTVQHGGSTPPTVARGLDFAAHDDLLDLLITADVVVCHGGPGAIADARLAGHRPLVIPRDPAAGEHVDEHQLRFAAWAGDKGLIDVCVDADALDRAVAHGATTAAGELPDADHTADTVETFGRLVDSAAGRRTRVAPDAPIVVFLGGFGRSGSTLVERMLNESADITALGEVVHLWERGLTANELCACGASFHDCEFWQAIGERAFGGWSNVSAGEMSDLREAVDRQRHVPMHLLPTPPRQRRSNLARYADKYAAIYRAAIELTGAKMVVDSSKHASLAFALSHTTQIDLRVIHLVRDSVAVAHSWSKHVLRPESEDGAAAMARFPVARTSLHWASNNSLTAMLRLRGVPVTRIRYEDLIRRPAEVLSAVWTALDLPGQPDISVTDETIDLTAGHSVAGNPMRFVTGPTRLRRDDEWRSEMPRSRRILVSALTAPGRLWYGYGRRRT